MPTRETGPARIDDLAREIIDLVRCRIAEGDSMIVVACGIALALDKMAAADPACAKLRRIVQGLLNGERSDHGR